MATTSEHSHAGLPRLHVITPAGARSVVAAAVEGALAGGAPLVQLRLKRGSDLARWGAAVDIASRCRTHGARLVVNDRADLAVAVGADGVHLGADDLPVSIARRVVGRGALIGATCRDVVDGLRAEAEGADYLGVGPAYATVTKAGLPEAIGPAGVGRVAAAVDIPVIAIGGVTAARAAVLLDAGAWGVAVCGAVFGADDPPAATAALMAAVAGRSAP